MYSKCIVSPFTRTPIAIIASKGAAEAVETGFFGAAGVDVDVRSVTEVEERRSVAEARRAPPVAEKEDCTWEEAYILFKIIAISSQLLKYCMEDENSIPLHSKR
jgi:hypothetical protein